jgi:fumarate reductase flavoprotein subunit
LDSFDVAIVGGGLAGLTAANRLAELGRKAIVLEKGTDELYMCNSRIAGGALHAAYREPRAPREEIAAAIRRATAGTADEDQVQAVAQTLPVFLDWLRKEGIRFVKVGADEYHRWVMAPPRPNRGGLYWKGLGGDVLLRTLEANFRKRGGSISRGRRVIDVGRQNDGLVVTAEREGGHDRFAVKGVIFCDGGFQANPELVRQYISPDPSRLFQRNAGTGCGDGLQIAAALGAALTGMERFYGHLLAQDVFGNERLWPWPQIDPLAAAGIVVDASGKRFLDETDGGVLASNLIARLPDPLSASAIFDAAAWIEEGGRGIVPPNPVLEHSGAKLEIADSVGELAEKLGLPRDPLEATVAEVNAATDAGRASDLDPPRKGKSRVLRTAPFRGIRLASGITYTMGGILIDGEGCVLDQNRERLPGLYAAGAASGGLEGGPSSGYVGGLAKAGVTGMRAAESAAKALAR